MSGPRNARLRRTPAQRLRRARRFYDRHKYSAAARDAAGLLDDLPADASPGLRDEVRLVALFAYARAQEFERGWQLVERVVPAQAQHLDLCYAACYLAYQRGDYAGTAAWGERYLALYEHVDHRAPHNNTHSKRHEILNTLGCAAKDEGDDDRALAYLDRAISAAPAYPLAYLNAVMVCQRAGEKARAHEYLERGRAHCGTVEELEMVAHGLLQDRKVSLCMIVRDEEEMLAGALESARHVVDEIIVVDTGSVDDTITIAESFGARVYRHTWEHDFSKARNQSLAYATGDWILILDADERLEAETAPLVRKLANACLQDAISFSVYNVDLDTQHVSFLPSIRMLRTERGFRYRGIVHNQIDLPPGTPVMRAPVRIEHYGYTPSLAAKRGKFERTTRLLRRQLEAHPDDAFAHFNMAQVMRGGEAGVRLAPQIIAHARRVTELLGPEDEEHVHILLMAYHQLGSAQFNLGRYDEAEVACRTALAIKPDFIDALITLGHTLSQKRQYDAAREAFQAYLRECERYDEAEETRGFILLHLRAQHQAHYGLGLVEEAQGHYAAALEWYRLVQSAKTDYLDTLLHIGQICSRLGRLQEARAALTQELELRPASFWARYGLGDVSARNQDWPAAYEHYQRAYGARPDHPRLPLNLARAACRAGRLQEAATHLDKIEPELLASPEGLKVAAEIAFAREDYETSRLRYADYLQSVDSDAAAWSDLGNVFFRMEDWPAAHECYVKALEREPQLHVATRNRALVLARQGQHEAAADLLEQYVAAAGGDPDAVRLLADLRAGRGQHARALGLYEQYLVERPEDTAVLFRLSQSYHAMGQQDAAILGYRHVLSREPGFEPAKAALAALEQG